MLIPGVAGVDGADDVAPVAPVDGEGVGAGVLVAPVAPGVAPRGARGAAGGAATGRAGGREDVAAVAEAVDLADLLALALGALARGRRLALERLTVGAGRHDQAGGADRRKRREQQADGQHERQVEEVDQSVERVAGLVCAAA